MSTGFVHTCLRVVDPQASLRFYELLGFERRGRLNFDTAYNLYLGLAGGPDVLELTVNEGRTEPYELGEGYNHIALVVDDIDAVVARMADAGHQPEKPPYHPGGKESMPRICFFADPDGYRIELIDQRFDTPRDPDR